MRVKSTHWYKGSLLDVGDVVLVIWAGGVGFDGSPGAITFSFLLWTNWQFSSEDLVTVLHVVISTFWQGCRKCEKYKMGMDDKSSLVQLSIYVA